MNTNPYETPSLQSQQGPVPANRRAFVLAGVGALLASAYWAAMTALLGLGAMAGSVSGVQVVLPCVLIGLYAYRGMQIFKGDVAAVRRILMLHIIGAAVASFQMYTRTDGGLVIVLQGIKVGINVFGAVTAYAAMRAAPELVA